MASSHTQQIVDILAHLSLENKTLQKIESIGVENEKTTIDCDETDSNKCRQTHSVKLPIIVMPHQWK